MPDIQIPTALHSEGLSLELGQSLESELFDRH